MFATTYGLFVGAMLLSLPTPATPGEAAVVIHATLTLHNVDGTVRLSQTVAVESDRVTTLQIEDVRFSVLPTRIDTKQISLDHATAKVSGRKITRLSGGTVLTVPGAAASIRIGARGQEGDISVELKASLAPRSKRLVP